VPEITDETAVRLCALWSAVGVVWNTLELLAGRRVLLEHFFAWPLERPFVERRLRSAVVLRALDVLYEDRRFLILTAVHGAAAILFVLAFPRLRGLAAVLAAAVLIGHLLVTLRFLTGNNGADRMQTIVWAGIFVYSLDLGWLADLAALAFLAAQAVVSYVAAGVFKLISPPWTSGRAGALILRTRAYSAPAVARAARRPGASWALSWGTIVFEVLGPGLVLLGPGGVVAFAASGLLFHVATALLMGLPMFLWAYGATYPVLYVLALRWCS
jgi:hypothetical protein